MPQDGGTGGGLGKVCVVAQLRERDNLRRYRLTRGKERVGGVIGWREAGRKFSQTQLSSSWVEWLRGIDRSWVFCAQTDIWAIESKYRLSFYSGQSVFTAVEAQLSLGNNCPPFLSLSLSLYLPPFIHILLHLHGCLCPIDHRLGHKALLASSRNQELFHRNGWR